jgi:hypothetical protein
LFCRRWPAERFAHAGARFHRSSSRFADTFDQSLSSVRLRATATSGGTFGITTLLRLVRAKPTNDIFPHHTGIVTDHEMLKGLDDRETRHPICSSWQKSHVTIAGRCWRHGVIA